MEQERQQREREEFEARQRQKMEEERLQRERQREENMRNSAQIRKDNDNENDGPLSFAGFAGMDELNDDNDYWMMNKNDLMESPKNKFDINEIDDIPRDIDRNISNVSMENVYILNNI